MLTFDKLCMGCMNDNGGEAVCPICGHTEGTPNPKGTLPIKTRIQGKYIIGKALEANGESITYIGWDSQNNIVIQVREFFPVPLAQRSENHSVAITEGEEFSYNTALTDFVSLFKKLKGISVAAIPEICDIIECNNTAYVVFKAVNTIPLREFLLRNGGTLSWEQARSLFMPLISSLAALHKEGIIHGGISPETVTVGRDGKLHLSGFSISQLRKSDSPINSQVFPGYAAAEQYGLDGGIIDESTDVYGFASTLFRVLMGSTLPEAVERVTDDKMCIPAKIAETLPKPVLSALANALQISKENRTKTIDDLKIDIAPAIDMTTSFTALSNTATDQKEKKPVKFISYNKKNISAKKSAIISACITAAILLFIFLIGFLIINGLSGSKEPVGITPVSSDASSSNIENSASSKPNEFLITVPDFCSEDLTFEQLVGQYPEFKFEVLGKKYSSKKVGIVVDQDIKAGTEVKRDTVIYVTLSLGSNSLVMPNLHGLSQQEALIELFKSGFSFHNISLFEIEDSSVAYHYVVKTDPVAKSNLSPDDKIIIYYSNVKLPEVNNTESETSSDTTESEQ